MDIGFFNLFGQVGATVVSIAFTLFVGYLLYVKEQRDRVLNRLIELRKEMMSLVEQLSDTPIPGVVHSLLNIGQRKGEKWDKLSLTKWVAGVPWKMLVEAGEVKESDVWENVRKGLEDLVRGIMPEGTFPEKETDVGSLKKWSDDFIKDTEHIEWFCVSHGSSSWASGLIDKMEEWSVERPNFVLNSHNVVVLLEKIVKLRNLTREGLSLIQTYMSLKIENAIGHYKLIIACFLAMGFFSIFIPLWSLLFPASGDTYIIVFSNVTLAVSVQLISIVSLLGFVFFSLLVVWILLRSTKK